MRARLGQHFLKDRSVIQDIVRAIDAPSGGVVVEIGPGHGELTSPLAEEIPQKRFSLICIEKDALLAERLTETLKSKPFSDAVSVMCGDARAELPQIAKSLAESGKAYVITGNLPYYATGYLLRMITNLLSPPLRCVLMVQKEVAERMSAVPPHMNKLAAFIRMDFEPRILVSVPKKKFFPVPDVDSAVMLLEYAGAEKEPGLRTAYQKAVLALYAHPRKTILNNLSEAFPENTKQSVAEALRAVVLSPSARPQDLSVQNIFEIARILFQ